MSPSLRSRGRTSRRALGLLALAALLAACDSSTSPPGTTGEPELRMTVVAGDGQGGFAGRVLPAPVTVRVENARGLPAAGVRVHFAVTAGGGALERVSAATDTLGEARASWRLGEGGGGVQALSVAVDGAGAATVRAQAFDPSEADVVVVRGAGGAAVRVVVFDGTTAEGYAFPPGDSVLLLPPRDRETRYDEVMVMAAHRRPALVSPVRWTPGRDTAEVRLVPALRIPLAIWIVEGPFERKAAAARASAAIANRIWVDAELGIEVGDVEVIDATGFTGSHEMTCDNADTGRIGSLPGRINAYFVRTVAQYAGYSCSANVVLMVAPTAPTHVFAHELGHSLGLLHVALERNFMNSQQPGPTMTAGQVFWMNFTSASALFQVYGAVPQGSVRPCRPALGVDMRRCIPDTFHFPAATEPSR